MIKVTNVNAVVFVAPDGRERAAVSVEVGGVTLSFTIWKNSENSFAWRSGSNIVRSQRNLLDNKQSAFPPLIQLVIDNWESLDHIQLQPSQSRQQESSEEVPQL